MGQGVGVEIVMVGGVGKEKSDGTRSGRGGEEGSVTSYCIPLGLHTCTCNVCVEQYVLFTYKCVMIILMSTNMFAI